jgi:hypothetical protein
MKNMEAEIRELKSKLKSKEEETDKNAKALASEHQELVDLREYIFKAENNLSQDSEELETVEDTDIQFPYSSKKKITVFGGHDCWLKIMKPMLPDVRFVPRDMLPSEDLARYSDAIWIQLNAISHAFCQKVVTAAKNTGVPIRYFHHSGPQHCARELARFDMDS